MSGLPFITNATVGSSVPYQIPLWPTLQQGWSIKKTPVWEYEKLRSVSGIPYRASWQQIPRWEWELNYEFLRDKYDTRGSGGLGRNFDELRSLMGFFNLFGGAYTPFYYDDPTDNGVVGQVIGTTFATISSSQMFTLGRTIGPFLPGGGFLEPVSVPTVSAVYQNGVLDTSGDYTLYYPAPNQITFNPIPTPGTIISVDMTYLWLVRFMQDGMSYENFMLQLWQQKSTKFTNLFIPDILIKT
jgi:Conserved hypothetical protein 2217 (DUF2460)